MPSFNVEKKESELDELAIRDAFSAALNVKLKDFARREWNRTWPRVREQIHTAQQNGDAIDVRAIIDGMLPQLEGE